MKTKLKLLLIGAALLSAPAVASAASYTFVPISTQLPPSATGYNQIGTAEYFRINGTTVTIQSSTGTQVLGTTTNDSAFTGYYGEYISSVTAANVPATGSGFGNDLVSLTLTAGDWDVSIMCDFQANGATVTSADAWVGTTAGNNANGRTLGDTGAQTIGPTAAYNSTVAVVNVRKSISGTTTYYLKTIMNYSVATPTGFGRISARRVR